MTYGSERRRLPGRRKASLFVGSDIDPVSFAHSRDLSLTGLFLETNARPEVGSEHEISIAWGAYIYTCTARVVRQAPDGVALTFVATDTFFLQAIQEIMATSPQVDIVPGR
ncbi:MAG: PilZ domain-containing protein [Myxococcota bacterium]